jgi:hypothetical protein
MSKDFLQVLFSFSLPPKRFDQVCSNAQNQPKELHKSDNTQPNAEAKQSPNSRKEINPRLTWICLVFHNCWSLEINLKNSNVFFIGIISCFLDNHTENKKQRRFRIKRAKIK